MHSSETLRTAPRVRDSDMTKTAQIVVELLRAGLEVLDTNREAATRHILKARLILATAGPFIFERAARALPPGGHCPMLARRATAFTRTNPHKRTRAQPLTTVSRL